MKEIMVGVQVEYVGGHQYPLGSSELLVGHAFFVCKSCFDLGVLSLGSTIACNGAIALDTTV